MKLAYWIQYTHLHYCFFVNCALVSSIHFRGESACYCCFLRRYSKPGHFGDFPPSHRLPFAGTRPASASLPLASLLSVSPQIGGPPGTQTYVQPICCIKPGGPSHFLGHNTVSRNYLNNSCMKNLSERPMLTISTFPSEKINKTD